MKLTKSSIFFLLLNALRLLSVVAICLVFAGEIYTINADIRGMHAVQAAAATPATTATTRITRRTLTVDFPVLVAPPAGAAPTNVRFEKVHRRLMWRLEADRAPEKREPVDESESLIGDEGASSSTASARATASSTSTRATRASKTTSTTATSASIAPTATNVPLSAAEKEVQAGGGCTYVGSTSIPKGPGGALFSTLERIFAATILLLALLSELPPPFPPLSRPDVALERFWTAFFPPFGGEYGVGVLGAVQVFVGAQVLSHYTTGWVQVSAWLLFLIGIFNLLAGLAFGARLKVLRSLSQDSTTPSALRRLRLQREAERAGEADRAWEQFDREPNAAPAAPAAPERPHRRSLLPSAFRRAEKPTPEMSERTEQKRAKSRNGPNGIVIGAPRPLRGGGGVSVPPPTYQQEGRE
ncbi:hypothetical protein JCM10450v2_005135 [Rhodotorula kratochvilovae]